MVIPQRQHRRSLALSCLGCTAAVMLLYATGYQLYAWIGFPYRTVELAMNDWTAKLGRSAPRDPQFVLLAEDAASHSLDKLFDDEIEASPALKLMKRRFWTREIWALTIERLAGAGARVIAFDIMLQGEDEGDVRLRPVLEKYSDRIVFGTRFDEAMGHSMVSSYEPVPTTLVPPSDPQGIIGFVNYWPEQDGITRRTQFHVTGTQANRLDVDAGVEFHSLAARIATKAGFAEFVPKGRYPYPFRYAYKGEMLQSENKPLSLFEIFVPTFWQQNYGNGAFFRDKVVLVGPEGNYTKDIVVTPFGRVAGPELHLNVLNAVKFQNFLRETPIWVDFSLIALGGAIAWLLGRSIRNPILRILVVVIAAGAWFGSGLAFYNASWVMPIFSPMLALVGSASTFSILEQLVERREKARLRRTFERYVSRDVVKELVDNPQSFLNTLGGVRKNITLLFSDVRGFTTLTEAAGDPHKFVAQLNEYFDEMVRIVFKHQGTLDKFIGDAVMAHWGSIVTDGETTDACRAVATALDMQRALVRLNAGWKARGMIDYHFGIGINHGDAIVGNLGSEEKREVTAIGDAVNLASRLEGATKEYHTDLLLGEKVAPLVRECFFIRTVDLLQVKGKTKPVEVFTVVAERANGATEPEWLQHHEKGVRLYRQRDFTAALSCFTETARLVPGDWLTEEYIRRAETYAASPPGPEWDGVYIMTKK